RRPRRCRTVHSPARSVAPVRPLRTSGTRSPPAWRRQAPAGTARRVRTSAPIAWPDAGSRCCLTGAWLLPGWSGEGYAPRRGFAAAIRWRRVGDSADRRHPVGQRVEARGDVVVGVAGHAPVADEAAVAAVGREVQLH